MFLPLKRYADFSGRSRRMEYWMFILLQAIVMTVVVCGFIALARPVAVAPGPDGTMDPAAMEAMAGPMAGLGIVYLIYFVVFLIPTLAVMVRRFHDQDKTGWLVLLNFIPFGGLIVLIFMLLPGTEGDNRYGPDPKAIDA
jgi:uncharacterized membrane protein YhaH (DUF805 family)